MHVRKWGWFLSSSLLIFATGIAAGSLTGCGGGTSGGGYVCGNSTVVTVHGTVVNTQNRPLVNYSVSINGDDQVRTNTSGGFSIEIDTARVLTTGNTFRIFDTAGVLTHIESRPIRVDSCSATEAPFIVGPPLPPTTP